MPKSTEGTDSGYRWAGAGDVNAFFGLMLDNIADLVLAVSLLATFFGFPASFAVRYMVPGTAIGVLFGDLVFTVMAILLARRTGRSDVTAMPLGLDTPSTFGMVFFVLGPAFVAAKERGLSVEDAARHTWYLGICAIVASGIFKLLCATVSGWIRRTVPRAGLLGSLTAIALVIISFLPLIEIFHLPVVGLTSLAIILTTLTARVDFPGKVPGTLVALVVGCALFYALKGLGFAPPIHSGLEETVWMPKEWLSVWNFGWVLVWKESLDYLPMVLPFALATVVGGIDCTESAAAAGDDYHTGTVIAVEGLATVLAGLCGGVIQTTPYIGHPAYKAMGGRAAYTFATALFIGAAGLVGFFGLMYDWIPKPAVFPILIFVGLEITAQSFDATPRKHFPAVAFACVPALAYLANLMATRVLGDLRIPLAELSKGFGEELYTIRILANGFIVTSLLWGAMLAALIDQKLRTAAVYALVAAVCSLFGLIHSPLIQAPVALPWDVIQHMLPAGEDPTVTAKLPMFMLALNPYGIASAYAVVGVMLLAWDWWLGRDSEPKAQPVPKAKKPEGKQP